MSNRKPFEPLNRLKKLYAIVPSYGHDGCSAYWDSRSTACQRKLASYSVVGVELQEFVRLEEANAAITQDREFNEATQRELGKACIKIDELESELFPLRAELESLREDNETLREAVKWGDAQTPNIMLACLRGLRKQLAEAVELVEHAEKHHEGWCAVGITGIKEVCNCRASKARAFLEKVKK